MRESLKANKKGIILMIASSLLVCMGQLFWKLSVSGNWLYLIIGFCLYGFGALVMLKAYSYGKVSELQPMLSMNYVFTIFLGYFVLGETFSIFKMLGTITIIFGVIMIGGSGND